MKFKGKHSLKLSKLFFVPNHIIFRTEISKVQLEDNPNVDYIYCLRYGDVEAIETNVQPLEVTETTIQCNLNQRQRSNQQILDLADYKHAFW